VNKSLSIEVRNLCKSFEGRSILDGVSLGVNGGQTVALVGPSGGGKSTLLRCLNGLNNFDAGEIRVGDHHLHPNTPSNARAVRRLLGMIFQDFQLFPHMTALENVIEAPIHVLHLEKAKAAARGRDLLKRVGLGDRGDAYPRQLSGGQKQRVAIARALAMEPRGLLCDEITSALDPELKNEVLAVLEDLKQEGLTLLMVTHEIGFARRAADRVVVLADGKIIEEGPPEQVLDCPQHPRTQSFLRRVLG
jgi:polar amino acid transport system ATP-binding protein